jgi:predicted DNA-binding ribbon-helix-helix protein
MSGRPVKHSVTLKGHRTSISLEDEFWHEFRAIASEKDMPINALVAQIGGLPLRSGCLCYARSRRVWPRLGRRTGLGKATGSAGTNHLMC